ncbi:hypothetical protein DAI22_03g406050 [Oryza sativa Japonica Group]|nr:hypothetical protein DAI22_03g406050 [Oryza sativa Japonica Group]
MNATLCAPHDAGFAPWTPTLGCNHIHGGRSAFWSLTESSIIMHSKTAQDIFECWRDTEWQLLQAQKSQQIHRGKESSTFHIVVDK